MFTDPDTGRHAFLPPNVYTSQGWLEKSDGDGGGGYGLGRHSHTRCRDGCSRQHHSMASSPSAAFLERRAFIQTAVMDITIEPYGYGARWNLSKDGSVWIMKPGTVEEVVLKRDP